MSLARLSKTTGRGRTAGRQGGFSFIEILIVMGIISVLVGGVVVAIGMWAEKGPEFQTKNTLNKTKMLIENWKTWSSFYPPTDVTRIGDLVGNVATKVPAPDNRTNEGIEAVYQALYWPGFKSDPEWDESELANWDDDKLRKAINKLQNPDLKEIIDGWGNPLVYFSNIEYSKYADSGALYTSRDADGLEVEVEARPWRNSDGTFANPLGFQIYSMGPDGEPNTDDDVTPWSRGD